MGSLKKSIIVIILSASILSSQLTYAIDDLPFVAQTLMYGLEMGMQSFVPITIQPIVAIGMAVLSALLTRVLTPDSPKVNYTEVYEKLEVRIDKQFDQLESIINYESNRTIDSWNNYFEEYRIFHNGLQEFSDLKKEYKNKFLGCVRQEECSNRTREQYINDFVINGHEKVSQILRRYVFRDESEDHGKRIFDVMLQSFEHADLYGQKNRCADEIPERQKLIYDIYLHILEIVRQHYSKIIFSQAILYKRYKSFLSTDGPRTISHMTDTIEYMKKDLVLTTEAARTALKKIPRDFTRLCDPAKHEEGKTYEKLTYFIQAYVVPKEHLVSGPTIGNTKTYFDKTCNAQSLPPFYVWTDSRYECQTFRQLVDCEYLAHSVPYISWKNKGYGLRYFKTLDESGDTEYGIWSKDLQSDNLPAHINRHVYHQASRPFFTSTKQSVEYSIHDRMRPFYICQLDSLNPNYEGIENVHPTIKGPVENFLERKSPDFEEFYYNTVRKFSELPVRVSSGKILTGVRFRVIDRIIYMQIQQGNYISGIIDSASLEWKKIDENQEKVQELNIHRRSFNLDDVEVPLGSFVTGVQFVFNRNTISLGVYGTKVDEDGEILYDDTEYEIETTFYPPPLNLNQRQEIKLEKPGPSCWAPAHFRYEIKSKPGISFVKFQLTDPKKDLHTTVPYLDIRMVYETVPKPLGGIGIEYRGKEGYGGFIGLKLIFTDIISKLNVTELGQGMQDIADNLIQQVEKVE